MKAIKNKEMLYITLLIGLLIKSLIDSGIKLDDEIIQFYEGIKPLIDKVRKGEK